jgi:glutamine amidotransferase
LIAIVDYGMGNLRSAQKGLEKAGYAAIVTDDATRIAEADGVVLPGVGAFKDCYEGLRQRGLVEPLLAVAQSDKPFLGICVGMQLLFEGSEEGEPCPGLGIFRGRVVRFPDGRNTGIKVPHMGWNVLRHVSGRACPLLGDSEGALYVYFVHSYYPKPEDERIVVATSEHGVTFPAMVALDNVFGLQFHPEKSQHAGLAILGAFGALTRGGR